MWFKKFRQGIETPKVSVIVKSYQRPWLLGVCLESIRHFFGPQDDGVYEVIVADDGTDPALWQHAIERFDHLVNLWVHSTEGEAKWGLCREGRFSEVVPSCGSTWNFAHTVARGEIIFVIEDDSFLTRPVNVDSCAEMLIAFPEIMCLIGLQERYFMDVHGTRDEDRLESAPRHSIIANSGGRESCALLTHDPWPWSFDGIFFRQSDWDQIGPWPETVATGPMENFVQQRLRSLGWMTRYYGLMDPPLCCFDAQTSCRTDHPSTYRGRFDHVDACNAAWTSGEFIPSFQDVLDGQLSWVERISTPMKLHYPAPLRQIQFVTGHELCGELYGSEADARWLVQANAEAVQYGEAPVTEVPVACRS